MNEEVKRRLKIEKDRYLETREKLIISRTHAGTASPNIVRKWLGLSGICQACGNPIRIQIFKGAAWCSDDCRKAVLGTED